MNQIITDMDERDYRAHPSLSSTGARRLLKAPAVFQYWRTHPEPQKDAFDLGTAVHAKVLGAGAETVVIPDDMLTPAGAISAKAKPWIAEARAAGKTPVKPDVFAKVQRMSEAVLSHREARELFEQPGDAEVSVFATDPDSGVGMKARFDYLPDFTVSDPWCVDLKTTGIEGGASFNKFQWTVKDHRYDIQQEWYGHALGLATGDFGSRMKFVVVEAVPPFLVGVHVLSDEFLGVARSSVRKALDTYAACVAADIWPGYPSNNDPIQPPMGLLYEEGVIA